MKQRLKALMDSIKRPAAWTVKQCQALDGADLRVSVTVLGVGLAGIGVNSWRAGAGWGVVGLLILLYVRPLMKWIK
jgi:hypothetical protein